jgi:hypothetical protein
MLHVWSNMITYTSYMHFIGLDTPYTCIRYIYIGVATSVCKMDFSYLSLSIYNKFYLHSHIATLTISIPLCVCSYTNSKIIYKNFKSTPIF